MQNWESRSSFFSFGDTGRAIVRSLCLTVDNDTHTPDLAKITLESINMGCKSGEGERDETLPSSGVSFLKTTCTVLGEESTVMRRLLGVVSASANNGFLFWILINIYDSTADSDLTPAGVNQALAIKSEWEKESKFGIPLPGKIYTSPLTRALRTCDIAFDWLVQGEAKSSVLVVEVTRTF